MRWIERLWRDDQRVKATPGRVAASLSDGVIRSTNLLRIRLLEQAFSHTDRKRFESEACILECLLFEWFLRDIVVAVEFGRHTEIIQKALGKRPIHPRLKPTHGRKKLAEPFSRLLDPLA